MGKVISLAAYKASKQPVKPIKDRRWVNVAYEDKERAKAYHCRWDADAKRWYLPDNIPIPVFEIEDSIKNFGRRKN